MCVGDDFVGLVLAETDTLSIAAHDKLTKHVAKCQGDIVQSMAAMVPYIYIYIYQFIIIINL